MIPLPPGAQDLLRNARDQQSDFVFTTDGRATDLFVFVWFSDNRWLTVFVRFAFIVMLFIIVVNVRVSRRHRGAEEAPAVKMLRALPELMSRLPDFVSCTTHLSTRVHLTPSAALWHYLC